MGERPSHPAPSLPATVLAKWTKLNDCLCLDTLMLADVAGESRLFLSITDYASRFGVVVPIASQHPVEVWTAVVDRWCGWAGFPTNFLVDGGGEFEAEFRA